MKLVFIAGPGPASDGVTTAGNLFSVVLAAHDVVKLGAVPVVVQPIQVALDGAATAAFWREASIDVMRRCDAVFFVHDWYRSEDARAQRADAKARALPCFDVPRDLKDWLST